MKMEFRRIAVCHDCLAVLHTPKATGRPAVVATRQQCVARRSATHSPPHQSPSRPITSRPKSQNARLLHIRGLASQAAPPPSPPPEHQSPDLNNIHARVQELSSSVLQSTESKIPEEERVLYVLEQLEYLARSVLDDKTAAEGKAQPKTKDQKQTATSALLGSVNARSYPASISKASILSSISARAEEIVRHPDVFLTPAILKAYIQLQGLLHQPSSFPDVFHLYARKPIPSVGKDAVSYSAASPDQVKSAVPSDTASLALTSAIDAHNLPLAMDIISTTFCTPAFKKAKVFRQAAFPIVGLGVAPIAAYSLSSTFSHFQQSMDPGTATGMAFAGIMTYIGAVSMVGYVAVTTANDQMDRVTWATGVPLWERWVREEERAAIDRLAGAWGFKELQRRGEEEGDEWDALREWVGSRGMVLDKVSLMEGME